MAEKIRVGIVGATVTQGGSGWGANAHVPALKALPDYELKAVCTSREETAKASQAAFGAELAFHDINDMVAHPDIDLIAVVVRVPGHYDLVMPSLKAGKATFCEWPLGANLKEAQEMASLAHEKGVATVVGLQARSNPTLMYARELVNQGYIGDVLAVNLSVISGAQLERGAGRIWQGDRKNGANTLTISGGHAIDAMCYVLGEFTEVSARVATRIKNWKSAETGEDIPVDAPDAISIIGALESGAEACVQVASVPSNPSGTMMQIFGRDGALTVNGAPHTGPSRLFGAKGKESMAEMPPPDRFNLVPEGTPAGQPRNVAQAYVRLADALDGAGSFDPDFDLAVQRHKLIDAIERSSAEGKSVRL
jgi:predicted dehydrogenase